MSEASNAEVVVHKNDSCNCARNSTPFICAMGCNAFVEKHFILCVTGGREAAQSEGRGAAAAAALRSPARGSPCPQPSPKTGRGGAVLALACFAMPTKAKAVAKEKDSISCAFLHPVT